MTIPDPKLVPQTAVLAGTVGAMDRSRQYQEPDPKEMLRAINEGWTKTRENEKAIRSKDKEIAELRSQIRVYKLKNIALTSVITGLAWEGLKVLGPFLLHVVPLGAIR